MALFWVACEARTGQIITDLPLLDVKRVSSVLGTYTTTIASMPVVEAPEGWERVVEGEATYLILLDDARSLSAPAILWGGRVVVTERSLSDVVTMSLASFESALDRAYVGDYTYTQVGQCSIIADLVERFFIAGGNWPLRVQVNNFGVQRDRAYTDASDKTVLSAISELSAVEGGPEFTVSWEWNLADPNVPKIRPVLTVGDRIGAPAPEGLGPAATFDAPGCVVDAVERRDYSGGHYANDVMASSSGVGDARPQSPRQTFTDPLRPRLQYRFTPSTSITEVSTLTAHAQSALAQMRTGGRTLSLKADLATAPQLGGDWALGDDIGYAIGGIGAAPDQTIIPDAYTDTYTDEYGHAVSAPKYPNGRDTVPAFPGGIRGVARCIGWELDLAEPPTVTPILELGGAQ